MRFAIALSVAWLVTSNSVDVGSALSGGAQLSTSAAQDRGLEGRYDTSNPFARILRGELPASKVYEDEQVLAFVSQGMRSRGHVLVISKTSRARNILEIEPEALSRVMAIVQRVARAQRAVFKADGIQVVQNNGEAGGQGVFHLHFHVIPIYTGQELLPAGGPPQDPAELDAVARQLAAAMRQ
jgi:histidine triad (HIT) family protein